jgi:ABC-2 type transport system permease protein
VALTLFVTFSLSWVAAVIGLLSRSVEAVQQFAMVRVIPALASSAFVPTSSMPAWLQVVAANQPITQAVDAARGLLLGQPVGDHLALAVLWLGGILAAAFVAASFLFSLRARA